MLPQSLIHPVREQLERHAGLSVTLQGFKAADGGCINHGGKLSTSCGDFFVKWNDARRLPGMFEAEKNGLEHLLRPGSIKVPVVIGLGVADELQFLILEYIQPGKKRPEFWQALAIGLAGVHAVRSDVYGLKQSNYIGSLTQKNTLSTQWISFFIEQRLNPMIQLALENRLLQRSNLIKFESLFKKLPSLLTEDAPCLVHGDLWAGNMMADQNGKPCLIDPAIYFGNKEVDIAMTKLFGGFDHAFYDYYHEVSPLAAGYEERCDLYNLYPLMVHVNLFGMSYWPQVNSILDRYK
jgi:fructosamine-3-kinase